MGNKEFHRDWQPGVKVKKNFPERCENKAMRPHLGSAEEQAVMELIGALKALPSPFN